MRATASDLLPGSGDSIVALATAPGRGAIALVRMSGAGAHGIARKLIRDWPEKARTATLVSVVDASGNPLDEALVTVFVSPETFTGEDMVEISTHGGNLVPASVVAALIGAGARHALAGEFTRRAVLNGKLDLIQAEAIGDLIDSRSGGMQRMALNQMDGGLSRRILALRDSLIELESLLSYDIDFPEEDDGPVPRERIDLSITGILDALNSLLGTAGAGEMLREGALVVIAGPPNAGKSALFNALLGRARAIVTEIPGTTRDAIEAMVEAGPWPVRLVDTAGLRTTDDTVERMGIEVSERYLGEADLVLCCAEAPEKLNEVAERVSALSPVQQIRILTKRDLVTNSDEIPTGTIGVSAETGVGLLELLAEVDVKLSGLTHTSDLATGEILTRARQVAAVRTARDELATFQGLWAEGSMPASVAAIHVREATEALGEMIGVIDVEDVFDRLFSSFCVGK